MTIHNPDYKTSAMASSQPSSTRRHVLGFDSLSKPLMEETQVSRPHVKFAPIPLSIATHSSSGSTVPKTTRPKLKPPASWTKQKTKEGSEDKNMKMSSLSSSTHPHSGHMSLPVSEMSRGVLSLSTLNFITENVQEKNDRRTDGEELLRDIDLGLADLNTSLDNYFNRDHV